MPPVRLYTVTFLLAHLHSSIPIYGCHTLPHSIPNIPKRLLYNNNVSVISFNSVLLDIGTYLISTDNNSLEYYNGKIH